MITFTIEIKQGTHKIAVLAKTKTSKATFDEICELRAIMDALDNRVEDLASDNTDGFGSFIATSSEGVKQVDKRFRSL